MAVWFDPDGDPIEVRLFVDSYASKYFKYKAIGPTQTILGSDPDGSIELPVEITHEMELIPLIKQWMPHIHILEPQWLENRIRKDVNGWLESIERTNPSEKIRNQEGNPAS